MTRQELKKMSTSGERPNYTLEDLKRDLEAVRQRDPDPGLGEKLAELEAKVGELLERHPEGLAAGELKEVEAIIRERLPAWQGAAADPTLETPSEPTLEAPLEPAKPESRPLPMGFPEDLADLYDDVWFVAEGGFARVYRAQTKDGRSVALKLPKALDPKGGRVFLAEVGNWQRLQHPNIVRLHDSNIIPSPYMELEWIEGGPLDALEKPIAVDEAAAMVLKISDAMQHAHGWHVIHRDLKPGNVLLGPEREPKVTDWGMSKVATLSGVSGAVRGYTLLYAAPEQLDPQLGETTEKTDVYQLGVMFYELVSGRVRFMGESAPMIISQTLSSEPPLPSTFVMEALEVDALILGCLAKASEDRLDLETFRRKLHEYLGLEYVPVTSDRVDPEQLRRAWNLCGELALARIREGDVSGCLAQLAELRDLTDDTARRDEIDEMTRRLEMHRRLGVPASELVVSMDRLVHGEAEA